MGIKQFGLRLPDDELEEYRRAAIKDGRSLHNFLVKLIRDAFAAWKAGR